MSSSYSASSAGSYSASATASSAAASSASASASASASSASASAASDASDDFAPPTGEIHRHASIADGDFLVEPADGVRTCYDAFMHGVRNHGESPCLGVQDADGEYTDWMTYNDVEEAMTVFGSGLLAIKSGENVGIYAKNCREWVIAEKACAAYSKTVVPLYDTLGQEAVSYSMNLTDMTTVVVEVANVDKVVAAKTDDEYPAEAMANVITLGGAVDSKLKKKAKKKGIKVFTWDEVMAKGAKKRKEHRPASPEDISTICFTSGTTGLPKGAMLSHGAMVADVAGAIAAGFSATADDVYLSYLPLAHVFERISQLGLFFFGARVGFYTGDTRMLLDDLKKLRPTVFATVPRLLNKVYGVIHGRVEGHPNLCCGCCCCGLRGKLFRNGVAKKIRRMENDGVITDGFYDKMVFGKVAKALGGRVRLIVTGSAPIDAQVLKFFRIAFGAIVLEGYGQTECCAACTITSPDEFDVGHVGYPLPNCEIALADVPSMGYYVDENAKEVKNYRKAFKKWEKKVKTDADAREPPKIKVGGEICIRGPILMSGYYKNDEKTRETIDEDGWLHTGDIGTWVGDGGSGTGNKLKIIDRKKNIYKLSQGEYVAPEKVENIMKAFSAYVAQMWLYGNSLKPNNVAVVVPDPVAVEAWAGSHGKTFDMAALCEDDDLKAAILEDFNEIGNREDKNGQKKLKRFEIPTRVHLEPNEWREGSDLATSTFKLKRNKLLEHYQAVVDELYA